MYVPFHHRIPDRDGFWAIARDGASRIALPSQLSV
jgi:hypothetical protein